MAADGLYDPEMYGFQLNDADGESVSLGYDARVQMSYNDFYRFMGYIGARFNRNDYYINILCLRGVIPDPKDSYKSSSNQFTLKLVENDLQDYNDCVIISYRLPQVTVGEDETLDQARGVWGDTEEEDEDNQNQENDNGADDNEYQENEFATGVVKEEDDFGTLKTNNTLMTEWRDHFLGQDNHLHAFKASTEPGSASDNADGTPFLDSGQHRFMRGRHMGNTYQYPALVPVTTDEDSEHTLAVRKPHDQLEYDSSNTDLHDDADNTNIHFGGSDANNVGVNSQGCIIIEGGNGEAFQLFILTCYLHGTPDANGKLEEDREQIPVTIWPGVDFFKWKKRRQDNNYATGSMQHKTMPELWFGTHDRTWCDADATIPGWVERMQRVLYEWRGSNASDEPAWGRFDKKTITMLHALQDVAIESVQVDDPNNPDHPDNPSPLNHVLGQINYNYYRRMYGYSEPYKSPYPRPLFLDIIAQREKEKATLRALREEHDEAMCGPATWEAMRFFCRSQYVRYMAGIIGFVPQSIDNVLMGESQAGPDHLN